MLSTTAKLYAAKLKAVDYKYNVIEESNTVHSGWVVDSDKDVSLDINCKFDDDNCSVHLFGYGFMHIEDKDYAYALIGCNELNKEFRWIKFYIDDDNDVCVEDDAVIQIDSAADEVVELTVRMVSIVKKAYPKLVDYINRR